MESTKSENEEIRQNGVFFLHVTFGLRKPIEQSRAVVNKEWGIFVFHTPSARLWTKMSQLLSKVVLVEVLQTLLLSKTNGFRLTKG